jgi:prepilin-type N-terminal cleavage/methylation domain-containing protein
MKSPRNQQSGFTLAEILVALAIASIVIIISYDLIDDAMRTSLFVESHNNLSQWAQRPINFIQTEIYQNKTIFDANSVGSGAGNYLTRFTTPPGYPGAWPACGGGGCGVPTTVLPASGPTAIPVMQANSLLPIVDSSNILGPDSGTGSSRFTGNVLLIARQLPPVLIPYDHDNNVNTPNVNFPADRYRFEMYYLTRDTTRPFSTASYFLDLIQARSVDFADYFQLNPLIGAAGSFSAGQKTAIVNGLNAAGLRIAWDPMNQPANNAFYSIANSGTMSLQANQGIWLFKARSLIPELKGGSISGKILFSVAFRPTSTTTFPIRNTLPNYAVYDSSIPEFPSGFEVKIVGAGAARKVLLRLLLMANYQAGKYDSQEGFVISSS